MRVRAGPNVSIGVISLGVRILVAGVVVLLARPVAASSGGAHRG
jgi:hypothetical protein